MAHNKENLVVSHTRKAIHPGWNTKKLPGSATFNASFPSGKKLKPYAYNLN